MQVRQIHQFTGSFRAVKNLDASVSRAVLQRVHDAGAQWNEPDAARNKGEVHAFVVLHRKTVAVRAAHGELVMRLELVERAGATANLPNGEKSFVLGGTGRQRRRKLSHAKQRNLGELSRAEMFEFGLGRGVFEAPIKRLDLRDVVHHSLQNRQLWQINIFSVGRVHFFHFPARPVESFRQRSACQCRRGKLRRTARSRRRPWPTRAE